jgi:tRNA A-37 threonylcarbamoyl transferase component Bud32
MKLICLISLVTSNPQMDITVMFDSIEDLHTSQSELCAAASAFYQKEIERKQHYEVNKSLDAGTVELPSGSFLTRSERIQESC